MAVYCPRHSLLFIGAKRTGSNAVGRALAEHLGGSYVPEEAFELPDGTIVSQRHSTVAQIHDFRLVDASLESLFKFTTVRNPFDSLVSWWAKLRFRKNRTRSWVAVNEVSFAEWVVKRFADAPPESMHAEFVAGCDAVMRFESLEDDLAGVLRARGIEPIPLSRRNPTQERPEGYRTHYDDRTRSIAERVFAEDLLRFGYSF